MAQPADLTRLSNDAATCLHLVVGAGRGALDDCLAQATAVDAVVFLDAGVLHLLCRPAESLGGIGATYFASADLQAHGLFEAARRAQVALLDDAGVCDLLAACDHCLTWR